MTPLPVESYFVQTNSPGEDLSFSAYSLSRSPPDARNNAPPGWPRGLTVHMKKSLDMFPAAELLPETQGLQPLVLESLPERTSTRHFHCTACFGMTAEVCTEYAERYLRPRVGGWHVGISNLLTARSRLYRSRILQLNSKY